MGDKTDVNYLTGRLCDMARENGRLQGELEHMKRDNKELLAEKLDLKLDNKEVNKKIDDLIEYFEREVSIFENEIDKSTKTVQLEIQYSLIIGIYKSIIDKLHDK